jgi:hypothetical protein
MCPKEQARIGITHKTFPKGPEPIPKFDKKRELQIVSSFSTPTFLTLGFQILAGIQAGPPLGFLTFNLDSLSSEHMDLLCAAFSEPDVLMASIGRFQGCLAGRFSRKYANLVALIVP